MIGNFGFDPGTSESLLSRLFDEADKLVLQVREEYAAGAVKIGLASASSWLTPGLKIVDWLSGVTTSSELEYSYKLLGGYIDQWATTGLAAARSANDPYTWDKWANMGAEYGRSTAQYVSIAWEYTSVLPQWELVKGIVKDWAAAAKIPFTPDVWPWWLKAGIGLGVGAALYSFLKR